MIRKLLLPVGIAAGALLALASLYGVWRHQIYTEGYNAAIAAIAAENEGAVDEVNRKKTERRNCVAGGGSWDQSSGLCTGV